MKKEKETTGTANAQGSGRKTTSAAESNATANMNPEAEGLQGWASTESRRNALHSIGDRITRRYNSLTPTQKVIGATLLAGAAVGTAYLTRDMWGTKTKNWKNDDNGSPESSFAETTEISANASEERLSNPRRSGKRGNSGEITM